MVRAKLWAEAFENVQKHIQRLKSESKVLMVQVKPASVAIKTIADAIPNLIAPHAFEVKSIADVKAEIFSPVLQVVRWDGNPEDVIAQINALGFGRSGTGPKAGGPHYLYRFCAEQTVTVNATAAGGNAASRHAPCERSAVSRRTCTRCLNPCASA